MSDFFCVISCLLQIVLLAVVILNNYDYIIMVNKQIYKAITTASNTIKAQIRRHDTPIKSMLLIPIWHPMAL